MDRMPTTTIPAELFLLLTTDAGRQDSTQHRRVALAAAALAELALREKITLTEERRPRVEVVDTASTGLPIIDQALGAVTELRRTRLAAVITHRSLDLTEVIGASFAAEGVVVRKDGWFTTTWPTHDDTVETSLRARLVAALEDPRRASVQDAVLLEILRALGIAHRILREDLPGVGRRDLERRIEALDVDVPVADAVRRVIQEYQVAMQVATQAGAVSS